MQDNTGVGRLIREAVTSSAIGSTELSLGYTPKRFKNIIDFVANPEGLNLPSVYSFKRQYQILRDFYSLLCPQCNPKGPPKPLCVVCKDQTPVTEYDCWDKTPKELRQEVLFEDIDGEMKCPQCGLLQRDAGWPKYDSLIVLCGMRSGKSATASLITLYELHKDLLLDDPQKEWGLLPGQEVRYTVAATSEEQSKNTTFAQVDGLLESAPWFVLYIEKLKQAARRSKISADKVFLKSLTDIRFLHKQLFIDIVGSNSASAAGMTRKLVVIDELSRFAETHSRVGVQLVYDTLLASLLTLSHHGSKMICISSPQAPGDIMMRLHWQAQEEHKAGKRTTLTMHYPTYLTNPNIKRDDPFIVEAYRRNPAQAERDFGANPIGSLTPWLGEAVIDGCVDHTLKPLVINLHTAIRASRVGSNPIQQLVTKNIDTAIMDPAAASRVVIACDPGQSRDSFGVIIAYTAPVRTSYGMEEHIMCGAAIRWTPTNNAIVDFRNVLDFIFKCTKTWYVSDVVFDQWNSAAHIQELMNSGVRAEKLSLTRSDWDLLATCMLNKTIHLLPPESSEDAAHLLFELKNMEAKSGGRVDHAAHSSSDLVVCLARAVKVLGSPITAATRAVAERTRSIATIVRFRR